MARVRYLRTCYSYLRSAELKSFFFPKHKINPFIASNLVFTKNVENYALKLKKDDHDL